MNSLPLDVRTTEPLDTWASTTHAEAQTPSTRRPGQRTLLIQGLRLLLLAAILGTWQYVSGRHVRALFISRPTDIAKRWWGWLRDGTILEHTTVTLQVAGIGLLLGTGAAVLLGIVVGRSPLFAAVVDPFISTLYSIPRLALVPIFILWFGIGNEFKIVLVMSVTFFFMFTSVVAGVRDVDKAYIDAVRIMGGKRRDVLVHTIVPSILVWIGAALKVSIPYALSGAVVAEMMASNRGLGYLLSLQAAQFRPDGVFAALVAISMAGFAANLLVDLAMSRLMRWKDPNAK